MRTALQRAADDNLLEAFERLVPYSSSARAGIGRFGGAVAVVTGTPSPFFNPVTVVGDAVTEAEVRDAIAFATKRDVRPSIQVREDLEPAVAVVGGELGYLRDDAWTPGMVLDPVPDPPLPPAELEMRIVTDEAGLETWYGAAPQMRPYIPLGFALDGDVRMVVGSVDGTPVTTSGVFRTDRVAGIYAVGTAEAFRRRGYGAAVTWAAIRAGRDAWGALPVILQSSAMGLGVYRSMGFREICRYAIWYPAPADAPS